MLAWYLFATKQNFVSPKTGKYKGPNFLNLKDAEIHNLKKQIDASKRQLEKMQLTWREVCVKGSDNLARVKMSSWSFRGSERHVTGGSFALSTCSSSSIRGNPVARTGGLSSSVPVDLCCEAPPKRGVSSSARLRASLSAVP